ncbi:MAG: hypothetical protein ACPGWR_01980 [Ardenticatenaceae bacterium]
MKTGLIKGAKTGFLLSLCYDFILSLIFVITDPHIVLFFLYFFNGVLIGGIPATLIGALTGTMVGTILTQRWKEISANHAFLVGTGISVMIALLISGCIWFYVLDPPESPHYQNELGFYLVLIGCPSMIYILVSGWMSVRLYNEIKESSCKSTES